MRSFIKLGGTLLGFLPVHTLAFHLKDGHVIRKRANCFALSTTTYRLKYAPGETIFRLGPDYPIIAINCEKTRWRFGWVDEDKYDIDK